MRATCARCRDRARAGRPASAGREASLRTCRTSGSRCVLPCEPERALAPQPFSPSGSVSNSAHPAPAGAGVRPKGVTPDDPPGHLPARAERVQLAPPGPGQPVAPLVLEDETPSLQTPCGAEELLASPSGPCNGPPANQNPASASDLLVYRTTVWGWTTRSTPPRAGDWALASSSPAFVRLVSNIRTKQPGMRWHRRADQNILSLRALLLSCASAWVDLCTRAPTRRTPPGRHLTHPPASRPPTDVTRALLGGPRHRTLEDRAGTKRDQPGLDP